MKVAISTSSFAKNNSEPMELLKKNGLDIIANSYARTLTEFEIIKHLEGVRGLLAGVEPLTSNVFDKCPELKIISRIGVGLDNIDLRAAMSKDIKIYKTTVSPAPAVSELVLGLMIDVSRKISKSYHLLKSSVWKKNMGFLLYGKTLGIIGLGTIGKELVKLVKGFNFNIIAYDQKEDNNFADKYNISYCDLNTLIESSDIISIHLNLSEETKLIFNEDKMVNMKSDAILINTSRGEIIDEDALFNALKNKQIAGAGLDVYKHEPYNGPLLELDNIVLTPHIGGYAKEIRNKMEIEAVENLIRGLDEI